METISTIITSLFTFFLVRRPVDGDLWRWAIVAKDRRDGTTYVYRPDHWRDTKEGDEPFRPYNEFSFVTANRIDPSLSSGWRVHEPEAKQDEGVPCARCGEPCDPEWGLHDYDGNPICESCDDDLFDGEFAAGEPLRRGHGSIVGPS